MNDKAGGTMFQGACIFIRKLNIYIISIIKFPQFAIFLLVKILVLTLTVHRHELFKYNNTVHIKKKRKCCT